MQDKGSLSRGSLSDCLHIVLLRDCERWVKRGGLSIGKMAAMPVMDGLLLATAEFEQVGLVEVNSHKTFRSMAAAREGLHAQEAMSPDGGRTVLATPVRSAIVGSTITLSTNVKWTRTSSSHGSGG